MSDDLINIIQREIGRALERHTHAKTLLVTSYDPKTHSIKGTYQPDGTESSWIPIVCTAAGQAVSHVHGPTPGDGKKTGDQAVIHFFGGDIENPHCVGFLHSDKDPPPQVQSGESLWKHNQTNVAIYIDKKGKITHQGNSEGLFHQTAKNGPINLSTKEKGNITLNTDKGKLNVKGESLNVTSKLTSLAKTIISKLQANGTVVALGPPPAQTPNSSNTDGSGDTIPTAAGSSSGSSGTS